MPKDRKGYVMTKSREWILDNCMRCSNCHLEKHLDWPIKVSKCALFTPHKSLDGLNWHKCPIRAKLPMPWRKYEEGTLMHAFQHRKIEMEALLA